MKRFSIFLASAAALFAAPVAAQTTAITGTVYDASTREARGSALAEVGARIES